MKMNKLFPLLLATAVLATGCASAENSSDVAAGNTETEAVTIDTVETNSVVTEETISTEEAASTKETAATAEAPATEETTAETTVSEENKLVFEAGTWQLYQLEGEESVPAGYCFMNEDGVSGKALMFIDKSSTPFEYEIGVNEVNVTVDGESMLVSIVGGDPAYVMFESDYGRVDMVYMSDITEGDIPEFYSNIELYEMAMDYYTAKTGSVPSGASSWSNEDGTVAIELDGENDEVIAAYSVDRWSTEGIDTVSGEEVNFLDTLLQQGE